MSLTTAAPSKRVSVPPWLASWHRPLDTEGGTAAILLLFGVFLFFYGLAAGELYRTESLRAIIAAEFLRSGNWIVPTLYGEPLFTKPPGMYAAIALASWPAGGVTEATARLPSAVAALVTVFLFFATFRRYFGRRMGLAAAVILPTSFMWLDKATAAEIDMLQTAWVAGAILCFLRALEIIEEDPLVAGPQPSQVRAWRGGTEVAPARQPAARSSFALWGWWLAALLCVAGGVLTKWTAPAFFYLTVVPLLAIRGQLGWLWSRHHLVAATVGASVCLAWIGLAVALTGWHVFYDTVSREALMRLLPSHHYRPYPWRETLLHPLKLLATNLPWSVVALLAFRPGFGQLWSFRERRLLQLLHCWVWPSALFWSVIPEHAIRHSFPLFPGLAGLAALVWIAWLTERWRWPLAAPATPWRSLLKPATLLTGLVVFWLVIKIAYVEAVIPARNRHREPRAKGELLAQLVPPQQTLYLFRLKDEGIMFYYGRPVRRLGSADELPVSGHAIYCILDESEWSQSQSRTPALPGWQRLRRAVAVQHLEDEQGAPIVLVRIPPDGKAGRGVESSANATKPGQPVP